MSAQPNYLVDHDFFSYSDTPLAVLAGDGTIVRSNDSLTRFLAREETATGRSLVSLVRDADRARVDASLESLETTRTATFDAKIQGRSLRFHATRADSGYTYLVGIAAPADRADDSIRLALFERILVSAPVSFFATDQNGTYTAWEGKGLEKIGSKSGELLGKNALEVWKDTELYPYAVRALSGEELYTQIALESGLHSDVWQLPIRGDDGQLEGMVGFAIDTSAQRLAEKQLRDKLAIIEQQNDTLKMFSCVLESAPLVLWAIDAEGKYTMSDGKGLDLLGFRPGEAVGLNALDMFKDHPDIARAITEALGGKDARLITTPAPGVHFENWYMPLRAQDGSVYGVMGLGMDASERIKGEHELREKLALIERQSATIRSLATPIIQVWDEVLCLPVIGTVDSARTADMMQGLLEAIVREQARYAIVDLTGVEVVDTSTADHLIQLFRAAKVLGVDGILCGIRPAVAQTVVALGLELGSVKTMRSLRDALKQCIRMRSEPRSVGAGIPKRKGGEA